MGFWHTGYMEFHEPTGERDWGDWRPSPPAPTFPCGRCGLVFSNSDDLAAHVFDGHVSTRPVLMLRGRECGRSRLSVTSLPEPDDWQFHNAKRIRVNDEVLQDETARSMLSSTESGVVSVLLEGDHVDQQFEFSFAIACEADLDGVDEALDELIRGRSLTINSIESFLARSARFRSAGHYRAAFADYFYGVLARERSSESGLGDKPEAAYIDRYGAAVETLKDYDRVPAEAICGLVAFHFNQFDLALRRTRSPRVAIASLRLAELLAGSRPDSSRIGGLDRASLDHVLSDTETEKVLGWCCVPLDGTATAAVEDMEARISDLRPSDELKLRIIAAEHHLAAGRPDRARVHVDALRNSALAETWVSGVSDRMTGDDR